MNDFIFIVIAIVSVCVITWRSIKLSSVIDRKEWAHNHHSWRFAAFSAAIAIMPVGAIAVAVGLPSGGVLLLAGVSMWMLSDRR